MSPAGELSQHRLGHDFSRNETPQLLVPGGYWKATELLLAESQLDYGLISEVVTPGFIFADMELATEATLEQELSRHATQLAKFIKV